MDVPPLIWGLLIFLTGMGLLFYWPTLERIFRSGREGGKVDSSFFGGADVYLSILLVAWFGYLTYQGFTAEDVEVGKADLILGALLFAVLVGAVLFTLIARQKLPAQVFGLSRLATWKSILLGATFLLAGYPAILLLSLITLRIAGGEMEPQEVVSLFLQENDPFTRIGVILMAVVVAPIAEEILFRGYIYGVMRKYAGIWPAALFSSALFAVIHVHIPTLGVLFFLALIFVLAYEATGSLLVPMTMHALFNAFQLIVMQYSLPS